MCVCNAHSMLQSCTFNCMWLMRTVAICMRVFERNKERQCVCVQVYLTRYIRMHWDLSIKYLYLISLERLFFSNENFSSDFYCDHFLLALVSLKKWEKNHLHFSFGMHNWWSMCAMCALDVHSDLFAKQTVTMRQITAVRSAVFYSFACQLLDIIKFRFRLFVAQLCDPLISSVDLHLNQNKQTVSVYIKC